MIFTHTWEQAVEWLRRQPDREEFVRHCYYDDPLEAAAERFYRSEEWDAVANLLGPALSGKVLDIGAGCARAVSVQGGWRRRYPKSCEKSGFGYRASRSYKQVGRQFRQRLASYRNFEQIVARYLSYRSNNPGRHYSFFAEKP